MLSIPLRGMVAEAILHLISALDSKLPSNADSAEIVRRIRMHTPAKVLVGQAGDAYRTQTQLQMREDHVKARDAVRG